ncbi:MAG TPA: VIT1/CCC1 transporter family protein [Candidatus Paceibacterota bacterium]
MSDALTKVFVRNVIFGVEDSLVSTVGLLAGIASTGIVPRTLLMTGVIYIAVEALSMAVGSYLSEESVSELETGTGILSHASIGALVMFASFVIAGFVPLVPYLLLPPATALMASVVLSLATLFALGFVHGRMSQSKPWTRALRMALLGGAAIALGIVVARLFGVS